MSRIGKRAIPLPEKVEFKVDKRTVHVKGPKGSLSYTFNRDIKVEQQASSVAVMPIDESREARELWGMTRTVVSNMITGVTQGFKKTLEFNGVGYKAAVNGNTMVLSLGYSHPVEYDLPEGISAKVNKNLIEVLGCDKELVGFVAAKIRSFRPPEPYKGKGIKYLEETIIRKAGKTGAKK